MHSITVVTRVAVGWGHKGHAPLPWGPGVALPVIRVWMRGCGKSPLMGGRSGLTTRNRTIRLTGYLIMGERGHSPAVENIQHL